MTKKFNWGILGTGFIANEMAGAIISVNGSIKGVTGINAKDANDFARKHNVENAYDKLDCMLSNKDIDIIYIATPHNIHYEMIMQSLNAGKHVFCEKSITVNFSQLESVCKLAKEKQLIVCDGVTLLHMPLYKDIRQKISEGLIGDVQIIQVNFGSCKTFDPNNRFFSRELAGGALLDIGVYAISLVRYFMKSCPTHIETAMVLGETAIDEISGIVMKNNDKQIGVVSLSIQSKQPKRAVICGTKGYIEIDEYPRANTAKVYITEKDEYSFIQTGESQNALIYEVEDMQKYIENGDDENNLLYVSDTMYIMSEVRKKWGYLYPFE